MAIAIMSKLLRVALYVVKMKHACSHPRILTCCSLSPICFYATVFSFLESLGKTLVDGSPQPLFLRREYFFFPVDTTFTLENITLSHLSYPNLYLPLSLFLLDLSGNTFAWLLLAFRFKVDAI